MGRRAAVTTPSALWSTFSLDTIRVKRKLLSRGWSLKKWSESCNPSVSVSTASNLLAGKAVQPAKAYALIQALGLEPDDLIQLREQSRANGA